MKPPESRALPEVLHNELLTGEEIQALLAPLQEASPRSADPVLVITPHAAEAEQISGYLRGHGVPVVTATNGYAGLDLLRVRHYAAFIAATEALPTGLERYLDRVREIDPSIPLWFIRERDQAPPLEGTAVARPVTEEKLGKMFNFSPTGPDRSREARPRARAESASLNRPGETRKSFASTTEAVLNERPGGGRDSGREGDPLLAVRSLLEAKLGGRGLEAGLRGWAECDPTIRGLVELREGPEEWQLRVRAAEPEERRRVASALLDQLGHPAEDLVEPVSMGPFSVFPISREVGSCLALWHDDEQAGREVLRKLQPLLPLIGMLPENTKPDEAETARDRFVALLASRMRAAERTDGRLGVLLMKSAPGDSPLQIYRILRALLRGGDWVEIVGMCVYVILDQPGKQVFAALGQRLCQLPGVDRLQVVALGWNPTEGDAEQLVERAERILEAGGRGEVLPGVSD